MGLSLIAISMRKNLFQKSSKQIISIGISLYLFFNFCNIISASKFLNNKCPLFAKTNAQIERKLLGSGFHRTLESLISLSSLEDLNSCRILMKDTLPTGVYIDPDQVKFMEDFGEPFHFIPQSINVEAPEHLSPKIQAFFFSQLLFITEGNWAVNFSVPVHLRYHRARPSSTQGLEGKVSFPHPIIFLTCDEELTEHCFSISQLEPCHPGRIQACDWLPISTFSTSDWVHAVVPVGDTDLTETVLLTTTTITCAAMLLILTALFKRGDESRLIYHASIS